METHDERKWYDLCDRLIVRGYSALLDSERVWLNIRWLIDAIENGGLISYFYNSGADTLTDCLAALDELDEDGVKQQVQRVCDLFPNGVPDDLEARNRIINGWPEEVDGLLDNVDNILMPAIGQLEERLAQFVKASRLAP